MKAVCVKPNRELEVREIPTPTEPAAGHVLIDMDSSAINHGDKTFLARPTALSLATSLHDVWGASGAGRVAAIGAGVPENFAGKQVAVYRSLNRSSETIGLWCERAQVPYLSCLILPDSVRARDHSGSLVNVITAYAFLEQIREEGHKSVVVTASHSATGRALLALARRRETPVLFLVRSAAAQEELRRLGAEHVLVTSEESFEGRFATLAEKLGATAVFDGVGGELINRLAPHAPTNSTFYFYGFLGGAAPISVASVVFMMRNLTMKRFSNFESATVRNREKLGAALSDLRGLIDDPLFRTRIGKEFRLDEIDEAMRFEATPGAKAVLVA
ncbi:zinc-binding dehydrogenase [Methylocapsa sp. S129]|uniref:zinc-binding dehydrogenase n=1 Tax=Methylocapsa sp. S129 TaxID=1641869 RepID=UPI00131B9838|nr:zinc-binding dehydrogenase [Methylocapsa sp. S129]